VRGSQPPDTFEDFTLSLTRHPPKRGILLFKPALEVTLAYLDNDAIRGYTAGCKDFDLIRG
jgi:hypothetical protein